MDRILPNSCYKKGMRCTELREDRLFNTQRIDHIYQDPHGEQSLKLHYGDLSDTSNLTRILSDIKPDEVYNLGAQSHVAVSFESPEYTADVDAIDTAVA